MSNKTYKGFDEWYDHEPMPKDEKKQQVGHSTHLTRKRAEADLEGFIDMAVNEAKRNSDSVKHYEVKNETTL